MAVTLYRCQKCRGLFAAVFEPNKWCRDCKFQQSGYQSQGGEAAQVTIIEPEEKTVGGKGPSEMLTGAVGGSTGDAQNVFDQTYAQQNWQGMQNAAAMQGIMGSAALQGYDFKFTGWVGEDRMRAVAQPPVTPVEPRPESSPHDSILKPSRKLKFAAE